MKCVLCNAACSKKQHEVFKCVECDHVYVNFTGNHLTYNKSEYRVNSFSPVYAYLHGTRNNLEIVEGNITEKFHDARDSMCNKRLSIVKSYCSNGKVLDIGSGGGTFALKLRNEGFDIDCQEISDVCIKHLKQNNFNVYEGDFCSLDFDKTYNLVTCWHVLEHIKNLNSFVKKCETICSDLLILEVPIKRSIPNAEKNWDGHFHYFSKQSLRDLFSDSFTLINITEDGCQKPCLLAVFKKNEKH